MLTSNLDLTKITYNSQGIDIKADLMSELGKLLSAAVINRSFRDSLLNDPKKSIENGYFGESFHLPKDLTNRIACVKSTTLEHFSSEVIKLVDALTIPETAELVLC
jgi:hypothetical protein